MARTSTASCTLLTFVSLGIILFGLPKSSSAAANPVVDGDARFTVVTPYCIRIEYSASGSFVDQPSLFAIDRSARYDDFRLTQSGGQTIIDTGVIRLTYQRDGQPFSQNNLSAEIGRAGAAVEWTPGAPNPGNLGGTVRTLDGVSGPIDLGQGLISRDGWYLLDDSHTPLLTPDWVEARPDSDGTDWYLFGYGRNYRAALQSMTAIGGPVPLPRRYALGSWYSRYWPYSSTDYRQIVDGYSQHDFPLDNIVMDMDWHKDGWTGWSWNRNLLPDAEQLVAWFHQQGLHVTLNLHPSDGVGPQEDQYAAFMRDMGVDPSSVRRIPFDPADQRYMNTLFADVFTPLENDGIDFWWLDWQQAEYTRSIPSLTNLFWLNTLLYQRTARDGNRGMSFSRWAGWGDHRHPIHFSGDAFTNFEMLAFEVPFTSTAGNVGCFFWSHDIGGHQGGRNEESYTRWVQFGATSPVLRSHSKRDATMDRRPWLYPKWAEDSMRISFHLRSELFPYIYTSAREACHESVPLDRPLYIDYPAEEAAYHNAQEYLFGDNLLVAPVVSAGAGPGHVATQTVWFPPNVDPAGDGVRCGAWYDLLTGERYNAGADVLVAQDIDEFPIYARGGAPIPMQPYAPRMASAKLSTLVLRCYPGDEGRLGTSTLYEDDGVTSAYTHKASAITPLSYRRTGNEVTVKVGSSVGTFDGQIASRSIVIELADTSRAVRATCDGKALDIRYDADTCTNDITVPTRSIRKLVTVTIDVATADIDALHAKASARRIAGIVGQPSSLKEALAEPGLSDAQKDALLAVSGVGYVQKNQGSYLYHGDVKDLLYAPQDAIDGHAVTVAGQVQHTTGAPIDTTQTVLRRGVELNRPQTVSFDFDGAAYQFPHPSSINDVLSDDNIASIATVTASGQENGYGPDGAVDGIVDGYPNNRAAEWSSGQKEGAWIQLAWGSPETIDRVELFDRPNLDDNVTSGTLTFSDGSTLDVGGLPNDGKQGVSVAFPSKTVTWVKFTITGVSSTTQNAGISEIAVFQAKR